MFMIHVIATEVITKSSVGISKFILRFMWKFLSHTVTVTPLTKNKQDALLVSSVNDD